MLIYLERQVSICSRCNQAQIKVSIGSIANQKWDVFWDTVYTVTHTRTTALVDDICREQTTDIGWRQSRLEWSETKRKSTSKINERETTWTISHSLKQKASSWQTCVERKTAQRAWGREDNQRKDTSTALANYHHSNYYHYYCSMTILHDNLHWLAPPASCRILLQQSFRGHMPCWRQLAHLD